MPLSVHIISLISLRYDWKVCEIPRDMHLSGRYLPAANVESLQASAAGTIDSVHHLCCGGGFSKVVEESADKMRKGAKSPVIWWLEICTVAEAFGNLSRNSCSAYCKPAVFDWFEFLRAWP